MVLLATLMTILREEIAGCSAGQCDLLMLSQLDCHGGLLRSLSESHQWAAPHREVLDRMLKHPWPCPFGSWQSTGRQSLHLPDKRRSTRKAGLPHHSCQGAGMDLMLP